MSSEQDLLNQVLQMKIEARDGKNNDNKKSRNVWNILRKESLIKDGMHYANASGNESVKDRMDAWSKQKKECLIKPNYDNLKGP